MADFRVKCIRSEDNRFDVGRIYDIDKNGHIIGGSDLGNGIVPTDCFKSWHRSCRWHNYDFEEVTTLPRICHILGGEDTPLEIGEEFQVKGFGKNLYHINDYGIMKWGGQTSDDAIWEVLNYPEKIIRKPRLAFSDDEKALMRLYVGAGYPWLAKDKDGRCFAYSNKPYKRADDYSDGTGEYHDFPDSFFPQITWENSPFNADEYLEGLEND